MRHADPLGRSADCERSSPTGGLLHRNVTERPAGLRTLLVGPLRFTPIQDERRRGYAFEGWCLREWLTCATRVGVPSGNAGFTRKPVSPQRFSHPACSVAPKPGVDLKSMGISKMTHSGAFLWTTFLILGALLWLASAGAWSNPTYTALTMLAAFGWAGYVVRDRQADRISN